MKKFAAVALCAGLGFGLVTSAYGGVLSLADCTSANQVLTALSSNNSKTLSGTKEGWKVSLPGGKAAIYKPSSISQIDKGLAQCEVKLVRLGKATTYKTLAVQTSLVGSQKTCHLTGLMEASGNDIIATFSVPLTSSKMYAGLCGKLS